MALVGLVTQVALVMVGLMSLVGLVGLVGRPLRVVVFDFESSSSRVVVKSSSIESSIE